MAGLGLSGLGLGEPSDLNVKGRKQQGHKRAQVIEDGIGKIGSHRYSKYTLVIGPTGIPWHQYRGYRSRILQGPTEVFRGKPLVPVGLGEHPPGNHDRQILIGSGSV